MNVLGRNIRALGFPHDQLKILLETFERERNNDIKIITEIWLPENDPFDRFEWDDYQPVESTPRKRECIQRRSVVVAIYVKEGIKYRSIDIQTEIDCSILQVIFSDSDVKNICAVYSSETLRLSKFSQN